MKNVGIKITFQALIWLLLIQPYPINAVQTYWYQTYFNKLNLAHYTNHCSLIDTAQKIRGNALITYYRSTHKKANLDKAICLIKNKLQEFESWLKELEQDALIAIKEKYHITDEIWHTCLHEMERVKNGYKQGLLHSHPDTIHDPNVPADILEILTTLLHNSGINPKSLHITMVSDQNQINQNPNTIALVQSFITPITKENPTISSTYVPASIEIFPHINNHSSIEKFSFYAHEIEHLIQQHSLTILILEEYLNHHYGITPQAFEQTAEYHHLAQIHEAQAEIFSAIKNPEIAYCHTALRKKYHYPNHLRQEHFYHLSTINMLWKVNAWLEFFHNNGLIKKRNELSTKIKNYGKSLTSLFIKS